MTRSPIRVGYDATSLLGQRTGVGYVAAEMLRVLATRPEVEMHAFPVTWRGRHDLAHEVPPGVATHERLMPARLARAAWSRIGRPRAEWWVGEIDLLHAPNFVAPPTRARVVVTVHDLTFIRYPQLCTDDTLSYRGHLERTLADGATIHAVSDAMAVEIRDTFGLDDTRVRRIYPGFEPMTGGDAERGRVLAGAGHYVVALGTIEPRKNLLRLVAAFDAVAAQDRDITLVLAGPRGWGADEVDAAIAAAHHGDRIRITGYVDHAQRRDLLAGARLLIYPSIYEGFGLPPLEAMSIDLPVVASSAGSVPEVLGDSALLPDPMDEQAIAEAIAQALVDEELRRTLIERGRERCRRFDWETTGTELLQLYRDVLA